MAIAFLNEVGNGYNSGGGDLTVAGTVNPGSNLYMVATIHAFDSTSIASVKWNGTALTQVGSWIRYGSANDWLGTFILANPDIGSFNLVIDRTDSNRNAVACGVWSGVLQTGQPDASTSTSSNSATTLGTSLSSVADNCWHIFTLGENQASPSSTTNVTKRSENTTAGTIYLGDSNGPKTPAGSVSQDASWSGLTACAVIMLTLAPAPETGKMLLMF
jgi:hypothetical protein